MTKENLETRFDKILKQKVNTTTFNKFKINKNIFSKVFEEQENWQSDKQKYQRSHKRN